MRIKTIIVIVITMLLTIALMQNTDEVYFKFLWAVFRIPKLVMMTAVSVIAFILGVLVGRPKRITKLANDDNDPSAINRKPNTLSIKDEDYIK